MIRFFALVVGVAFAGVLAVSLILGVAENVRNPPE